MDVRNFGKQVSAKLSHIATAVAAGAGDNSETDGASIDRKDAHSALIVVASRAVLAATKKLTVKATLQDSADGTSWADVAAALQPGGAADSVIATLTGGGGGTTETGVFSLPVDLSSLRRYVRVQTHMDLDAANTDVGQVAATVVLGGLTTEPAGAV